MAVSELCLDDYSVYSQLSEEELLQIAVERSFSDKQAQRESDQSSSASSSAAPAPLDLRQRYPGPPRWQQHVPPLQAPQTINVQNCAKPPTGLWQFLYTGLKREVSHLETVIMNGDVESLMDMVQQKSSCLTEPDSEGWISLHQAASHGQLQCLRILVQAYPTFVNKCTSENRTPLLIATNQGHISCVEFLLSHGANINAANKARETPLFVACEKANEDMVELLLSSGAQVNRLCSQGGSVLHEACRHGNARICRMLLDAGADMKTRNVYGIQPFFITAQHGYSGLIHLLAKRGADVNSQAGDGASALYEASKNGHVEAVKDLLHLKVDPNRATKSGLLPLHVAVRNNHQRVVSLLIPVTSRFRVKNCGISPLHIAAERNRDVIMELLIEAGFNVNAELSDEFSRMYEDRRTTALYFSVHNGNFEAAEMLLEAGANPNLDTFNPLLIAVRLGWLDMAKLLVRYGADVNAQISTQPSAFPSVILLGMEFLPMLKLLLDCGCDARNCFYCQYGLTPHPTVTQPRHPMEEMQSSEIPPPRHCMQFCEAISASSLCRFSGPITSMLLDYVGHVRLCSKLLDVLERCSDWKDIKLKAFPPHPLMQLCRLKIRQLLGVQRLRLLPSLVLPTRLIRFLQYDVRGYLS